MVDVVAPRTVPSENEVHVARSFLTKILRSSMRKNEPVSRPHSWHSSKLTEEETEPTISGPTERGPPETRTNLAPVWQPKDEARSKEVSGQGDQSHLQQLSSQFRSVSDMERLERSSRHYSPGRLSPNKYTSSPEPLCEESATKDARFSCFSSSSSPPIPDTFPPSGKRTSTENIFFRGLQSEAPRQAERPKYLQPPLGNGGWERPQAEDQPSSRGSFSGRMSVGPMWQVPERRKNQSSPPPPPPPLRSDSFAATKVFPYTEGPPGHIRSQGRGSDGLNGVNDHKTMKPHHAVNQREKGPGARRSFNPQQAKDFLHPSMAADHNHNQLHPNKLFSLSSIDVRQTQSHSAILANHQRQYSDESPLYLQTRSAPQAKHQSVGSYYRSLQDLPTDVASHKFGGNFAALVVGSTGNPSLVNVGQSRYYSMSMKQSVQPGEFRAKQGKVEGRLMDTEVPRWANAKDRSSISSLKTTKKNMYTLPQSQLPYADNREPNDLSLLGKGLLFQHPISELASPVKTSSVDDNRRTGERQMNEIKHCTLTQQANEQKVGLQRPQDPSVPQEDHRISPVKTPFLHSLTQESRSLAARQAAVSGSGNTTAPDVGDTAAGGKAGRRGDRYATALRNEIQQKRAQLQKSRSAVTLTCGSEEEAEGWKSTETSTSSDGSFSNTYKDHLKEAQARVLQATSFQRRDLEPPGGEAQVGKSGAANSQLSRIGGRKRFSLAKRVHSFSEPDKIDMVGMEGEPHAGSFGERRRFFEAKPAFSRPAPKSSQPGAASDLDETAGAKLRPSSQEPQPLKSQPGPDSTPLSPGRKQALLEEQRLGTFAEYQATWSLQRKPSDAKIQGRYHSAENILDADAEEMAVCVHERSRSSPSADFYTQNGPVAWGDPVDMERRNSCQSSLSDRGKAESRVEPGQEQGTRPTEPVPGNDSLGMPGPATAAPDHTADRSHDALPAGPSSHSPGPGFQLPVQPVQTKSLPPPPRPYLGPETTSCSQEFLPRGRAELPSLQPLPSSDPDVQCEGTSSAGHAPGPDARQGPSESGTSDRAAAAPRPPAPSSSSPSSSPLSSKMAALSLPTADGSRGPSPQFSPRRLTERPPAARAPDNAAARTESRSSEVTDATGPMRKVPVRIVHAETSQREGRAYLAHNGQPPVPSDQPHPPSRLASTYHPLASMFSAYTRQPATAPFEAWESGGRRSDVGGAAAAVGSAGARGPEEDAKREELARDIVGRDKALADILDQRGMRTTMDLMEGLFPQEEQMLEGAHPRRRAPVGPRPPVSSPRNTADRREEPSLVPSSSYYNTSAPKAELLIKMKELQQQDSEEELDVDLVSKKRELISSLAQKLEVLREARQSLQEDVEDNEALGREVEASVQRLCQPNQLDKFCMFVGDLDKVVSLLLSLSGRLARVENALDSLEEQVPPQEKRTLTEKRALLLQQHEDARELKENLDRRERLVSRVMEAQLDAQGLDDYRHFVKMKSALIIEQRKLEDKIKLGEEQLRCLLDSLPLEQRPPL